MDLDREKENQIQNLALIGQLAGGVAHDFNNLLTAMLFNLELVKRGTVDRPELVPSLRALDALLARASTTTRQLLTFARQRTLDARPLELNAHLNQSLELLGRLLGENIEVLYLPDPVPYWVVADATMIDQAVLNLSFNARDAMPAGGVLTVETSLYEATEVDRRLHEAVPGEYIELRFSDTGHGIDPEHLAHVFEPFFTTKGPGRGTGLGLASVYGGARQHGGWADVKSTLGRGTMVSLYFPRIVAPRVVAPLPEPGAVSPSRASVLVVDDEEPVRTALTDVLEQAGYEVRSASNAAEGWRRLEAHRFDVVVTDWMMPGALKGLEWATRIRAQHPHLAVVLMSGYSTEALDAPNTGDIVLLSKPFPREKLLRTIETALDRQQGGATAPGRLR